MYSFLYFQISDKGTLQISNNISVSDNNNYKSIQTIYLLRLVNNLLDFILISVYYLFLLFVKNFWDIIFMTKIGEIYCTNYDFSESEKYELSLEYLTANQKLEKNKRFRIKFMKWFSILNVSIFGVQTCYIYVRD